MCRLKVDFLILSMWRSFSVCCVRIELLQGSLSSWVGRLSSNYFSISVWVDSNCGDGYERVFLFRVFFELIIVLHHNFFLVVFVVSLYRYWGYFLGCNNEGRGCIIGISVKGRTVQAGTSAAGGANSGGLGAFPIAEGDIEMVGV
jgi:hypothetical protein